jgi:hypothetical protein
MRPNEVKGFVGQQAVNRPDRVFYVLEKHVQGDRVWELDGYCLKNGTTGRESWKIHMICPRCDQGLTINSDKKSIEVSSEGPGLFVEPFECAHPSKNAKSAASALCGFRAALDRPASGDQKILAVIDGIPREIRVDAVFKGV